MTGPASPDVVPGADESVLPGGHRGGFGRLPTGPVGMTTTSAPAEPGTDTVQIAQWAMPDAPADRAGLAGWALAFSIVGLLASLFVGWGFPMGVVGIVTAILALRRPRESRLAAIWAVVLGIVSVLYSAGWLLWAATRADLIS